MTDTNSSTLNTDKDACQRMAEGLERLRTSNETTINYTVNDDALDELNEKLEQIYALMQINIGNDGAQCWRPHVADGFFTACANLAESAQSSLKKAVVRD